MSSFRTVVRCGSAGASPLVRLALNVLIGLGLSGCLSVRPVADFAAEAPEMRPEAFFAGSAHSWGVLEARSGAPSKVFRVASRGKALRDGGFRLDQTIDFEGEPSRERSWTLRRTGPHQYTASLSDASGPVRGEAYGNLFHLQYPTKSPVGGAMEQWLYLQPDGRTVLNEATVRVAGLVVARLSERISRDDPNPAPTPR